MEKLDVDMLDRGEGGAGRKNVRSSSRKRNGDEFRDHSNFYLLASNWVGGGVRRRKGENKKKKTHGYRTEKKRVLVAKVFEVSPKGFRRP